MRFHNRKRRAAPAIIIVALIDVLIVLVIFLLVTMTFKQQPSLRLTLPTSTQALKSGANDNPPFVVNIVSNDNSGTNWIFRAGPEGLPTPLKDLQSRLNGEAAKNPQLKLAVRADKNAPWQMIVQVMDAAGAAHIKVISAFTKEAGQQ